MFKIAIIGLGYVGLPLALEFSKKYSVLGFDLNIQRVYSYISFVIREYKKNNNDNRSYSEILQYLFEIEQFIFCVKMSPFSTWQAGCGCGVDTPDLGGNFLHFYFVFIFYFFFCIL